MKQYLLLFLPVLCVTACPEGRAAVVELDLEKLTLRSSHIFCGEVVAIQSRWDDFLGLGRAMITDVRIKVSETWRDSPGKRPGLIRGSRTGAKTPGGITEITIQYLGGRIGERWQKCSESPHFLRGEKVLVFARELNGALWSTGWFQGKYRLESSPPATANTGKVLVMGAKHLPVRKTMELRTLRLQVRKILQGRKKTGGEDRSGK